MPKRRTHPKERKSQHEEIVGTARVAGSKGAFTSVLATIAPESVVRSGETLLEMAERHIAEAEFRIAQQIARIDQLRADGHETTRSEALLIQMRNILAEMHKHRDLIRDLEKNG